MIIICPCGEKKFEVDGNLIPEKGRTLQCGSCDHKWFFKKDENETVVNTLKLEEKDKIETNEITINDELSLPDDQPNIAIENNNNIKWTFSLLKIFNYFIVLIITLIAVIVFLDTFKYNLTSIFPNLELFLYNLYESIKDIKLFINDLIK
ncbi:zinc-ribbon domain-containing protein [Candidatus Pelagibacter sp.]|nr:zinc-ribbon domain-containing protein [Candidatus Pelagibacter sp.]